MWQSNPAEYKFYTEFQSHEAEFDYLKSLEIEEKINQIEWLKRCNVCPCSPACIVFLSCMLPSPSAAPPTSIKSCMLPQSLLR
jgi:hypothetical protein